MDYQRKQQIAADIAASMHDAVVHGADPGSQKNTDAEQHGVLGLFGNAFDSVLANPLFRMFAMKLLAYVEEIVHDQVDKLIIQHGGGTGGLFASDQNNMRNNPNNPPAPNPASSKR